MEEDRIIFWLSFAIVFSVETAIFLAQIRFSREIKKSSKINTAIYYTDQFDSKPNRRRNWLGWPILVNIAYWVEFLSFLESLYIIAAGALISFILVNRIRNRYKRILEQPAISINSQGLILSDYGSVKSINWSNIEYIHADPLRLDGYIAPNELVSFSLRTKEGDTWIFYKDDLYGDALSFFVEVVRIAHEQMAPASSMLKQA
ncbi:hypothetical protein IC614_07015 [Allosphingosinicella flava]|uniref:Uncharacterized protein n=1 Tax=Allosphingosinicella flava TaxID=2771430 RepID=A0A7T2GHS3_9SPHN|nr:hypothetical protein [Sphingosinicella flava]QPQ54121.1 hypothetical protein IC614_07015 [Sphingosinicella flava]